MFIDIAKIKIVSGKGGDGKVGFHREKYVAAGGPDGGDGGRGGSVIFKVDDNLSTLLDFRYKKKYVAAPGEPGGGKRCKGKDGADLIIRVPRGTIIRDQKTGQVMKDMSDSEPFVAAKGGNGGWGNTHFATPTRQAPRFAKPGLPGVERDGDAYVVTGAWVDKIMGSVNIDDYESRQYMDRMLQSAGIYAKLEEMGIEEGAPVVIGEFEFEYVY